MDTKVLLEQLAQNNIPVLEHLKWPEFEEDEIRLNETISIQVSTHHGGHYCLTYEEGEDTLAFEPFRYSIEEILADVKKHLKVN